MPESNPATPVPDQLTAALFQPHAGSLFSVNGVPPLKLAEVRSLAASAVSRRAAFALEFTAEHDGFLPQGTYLLQHDALGALEVFLVPLGPGPGSLMRYEAIFN
jgi:hypothetical protein